MLLRQVLELFDLLDKPSANGLEITNFIKNRGNENVETIVDTVVGPKGEYRFRQDSH